MISMECTHPDLEEFISIKNDLTRVTKANISVMITDDFMRAVEQDEDWELSFKTNKDAMVKVVKAKEVFRVLSKNNWDYAEPGILYKSKIDNWNLLSEDSEFSYAGVNPCAEEPLPNGGSCLLGSINLSAYIVEKDGVNQFDTYSFEKDIHKIVKGMNEVLDQGLPLHPLQIQRDTVRDYRQIGIGVMGIADMLIKLGLRYDSDEAINLCDSISRVMIDKSIKASALLAKETGAYPKYNSEAVLNSPFLLKNTYSDTYRLVKQYGLKNSQLLTIAPTGSLSTMLQISGGIEPIFANSYTRKTESLHGEDVYYKVYTPIVKKYMDSHNIDKEEDLPDFFVTSQNINPFKRVEMQGVWQKHIDASISSTINLPEEATIETVESLYMHAWKCGLKGLTIFRDKCARTGILTTDNKKEEPKESDKKELKRGEWESRPKGTISVARKVKTGCGKETLHIYILPNEKRIFDFYVTSSSQGGCKLNIQGEVIAMSAMLRVGGNLQSLKKAYSGLGGCPSFASAKAKGKALSKGSACPLAILNTLLQVQADLENECLEELEMMGYYNNIKVDKGEQLDLVNKQCDTCQSCEFEHKLSKHELFTEEELKFMDENGEVAFAQRFGKCPSCGEKLEHSGGCITCTFGCGWTKC